MQIERSMRVLKQTGSFRMLFPVLPESASSRPVAAAEIILSAY